MPLTESYERPAPQNRPGVGLGLVFVVVGIIIFKVLQAVLNPDLPPGEQRGDILLQESCLPAEIGSWVRSEFIPPKPPDELPEGQYWWSHSWLYQRKSLGARVAFDQADFVKWHDLTICYRANGWKLIRGSEVVYPIEGRDWPCTTAEFEQNGSARAFLVFSMFDETGSPIHPGRFTEDDAEASLEERILGRPRQSEAQTVDRALQCQVFAASSGELTEESVDQLIELHVQSRERFRDAWRQRTTESSFNGR